MAAASESDQRYRELIHQAVQEYEGGRPEEALALFEQAYRIHPSARVLRGMAKAKFELRAYANAIATIDSALQTELDPLTESMREELQALRERASYYVGVVLLVVRPRGAVVLIDHRPLEPKELERPLMLDLGRHELEVSAPGHREVRRVLQVAGKSETRLVVALEALPMPATHSPLVAGVRSTEPGRTDLYVAGAITALGIGGVVASVLWFGNRSDAVDRCTEAAAVGARCENASSIETERDVSAWAIGGSAALALGGGVGMVVMLSRPDETSSSSAGCGFAATSGACSMTWRF